MKKYSLLLLLLGISIVSFAQFPNWRYKTSINSNLSLYNSIGQVIDNNNSVQFLKEGKLIDISYYGEHISTTTFNFIGPHFNDLFKRSVGNQDIYITTSTNIYKEVKLSAFSLNGEMLGESLVFESALNTSSGHFVISIIEKENGDFVLFATDAIYVFKINDDFTWEIRHTIPHEFSVISNAIAINNQYFITTDQENAALLTENFETIWTINTPLRVQSVKKIANGYILCGNNAGNAVTTKLDENGNIVWSQSYENKSAYDILQLGTTFLVAGKTVFTVDENGGILWEKEIDSNDEIIYKLTKSRHGSVLMMSTKAVYLLNPYTNKIFETPRKLASNNVEANLNGWGGLDNQRGLVYPIGKKTKTIFAASPSFVSLTESGTFKGFAHLYTGEDFTGVISTVPHTWKIYQKEIDIIQQKLSAGDDLAPYSQSLLTYPAKGNPNCIINMDTIEINYDLAPFVDVNGDGLYNMFDGDYPEMKGDQMVWWAVKHLGSEIEIHGRWYAYDCGEHLVSNTIYADYEVINTSIDNLPICFFGKLIDFDLGCPYDDYIGSLPDINAAYVYNEDDTDGITPGSIYCAGASTYIDEIPIQSITFLDQEMGTSMYYNSGSNFSYGDTTAILFEGLEYIFNQFQAIFSDGTHLTFGGNGYDMESTDFTNYIFSGNPSNTNEWSMAGENLANGDRRVITATNAFSLASGESKTFAFAYTTHPNIPHPAPDVTPIIDGIQEMTAIYDNGNTFATVFLGQDQSIAPGESIILNAGDDGLDYVWSTNEGGMNIQVTEPGTYSVTVTDETGCQRSDEITITALTGLAGIEVTKLAVYPNPAKSGGKISIELPNMEDIAMVKLFNIIGQELYSEQRNEKTQKLDIKLSNTFSTGVYMVQLTSIEGKVMVGKVLVE